MNTVKLIGTLESVESDHIIILDSTDKILPIRLSNSMISDIKQNLSLGSTIGVEGKLTRKESSLNLELHVEKLLYMNKE